MKKFSSLHKGFTLVELMIVIAIIGILAAVLYPALTGYLERTRDTNRQQAMNQMGTVFGTYYADRNEYPSNNENNCLGGLKTALIDGSVQYLKALPKDPKLATNKINNSCTTTGYGYKAFNGNANYIAGAKMEIVANGNMGLDSKPTGITTGQTYNNLVNAANSTVEHIRDSIIEKSKMGDLAKGKDAVFVVYNQ